jgi:hypothetical protein
VDGVNRARRARRLLRKVRWLHRVHQERHLKKAEAGADPEQLPRESPHHQNQLLRLRRRCLRSAEKAKAAQRQADRHNVWHRLNGPLLPRPLNPQPNPEDDPSVVLPAPLPNSLAAQVRQRQAGRKDAVLSKLALRQLHLRVRLELQVEGEESREHNRVSRPLLKLPLRLSVAGGNPRAERKKARKLLLHRAPNNTNLV